MDNEDLFQVWLMDMSDLIHRFCDAAPKHISEKLDYSPDSLYILEEYILNSYHDIKDTRNKTASTKLDGAARYVGEVFRTHLGGKWIIDYSDAENVFYGLPQLKGMQGQKAQICPLTLVTASVDRRTGKFIRTIFDNMNARNP